MRANAGLRALWMAVALCGCGRAEPQREVVSSSANSPAKTTMVAPRTSALASARAELTPEKRKQLEEMIAQLAERSAQAPTSPIPLPGVEPVECAPAFCVRVVDDATSLFEHDAPPTLPAGAHAALESVPFGAGMSLPRTYVEYTDSSAEAGISAALSIPAKRILAFGPSSKPGTSRTFLLAQGFVSTKDVQSVRAVPDDLTGAERLEILFNEEGKKRFAAATTALVNHRIAILIHGVVTNTPVVLEPLTSGRAWTSAPLGMSVAEAVAAFGSK